MLYCSLVIFETLFRLEGLSDTVPVSIGARDIVLFITHSTINPLISFTDQVRNLLFNMRHVYRHQNSYHNFEHALDVLQAIHMFLCSAGRVPPASILLEPDARTWRPKQTAGKPALVNCLTPCDLFCLYVASIGHDVGHPGVTNNFMVSPSSSSAVHQSYCSKRRKMPKPHYRRFMIITLHWNNFTTPSFCTSFDARDSASCLTILIQHRIFENCSRRLS